MKCPGCEKLIQNGENACSFCGWSMAGDVTVYGTLFTELQIDEYKERLVTHRELMKERDETSERSAEDQFEVDQPPVNTEETAQDTVLTTENKAETEKLQKDQIETNELKQEMPDADEQKRAEWVLANARYANMSQGAGLNLHQTLGLEIGASEDTPMARTRLVQEICSRIADGSFEGLHVGDYFYVTLSNKEKMKLVLAGFGTDLRRLKPQFADKMIGFVDANGERVNNYAWVVPEHCFQKNEPMQKLRFMERPDELISRYEDSYLYKEILPEYTKMFRKELDNRIVRYESENELELLRHEHLYGDFERHYEGLPLFVSYPEMREAGLGIKGKTNAPYWLRDKGRTGFLSSDGHDTLPYKKLGVRPYFRIG